MKLPEGTVYAKGKPMYFEGLSVHGGACGSDFTTRQLVWFESSGDSDQDERWHKMQFDGASFPMNADYGRDGCFDQNDLFLVYEKEDLLELRRVIDEALK